MKVIDRLFVGAGALSLMALLAVSSCEFATGPEAKPSQENFEKSLRQSEWRVWYQPGGEEGHQPMGYQFEFLGDGSMVATAGGGPVVNGIWSTFGGSDGNLKLNLEFDKALPFERLENGWVVVESSDRKIRLEDSRAGGTLILEKV